MSLWAKYGDVYVPEAQEGWAWPLGVRRAHYFHRTRSLCGELTLTLYGGEPDRIDRRRVNRCETCDRRREKLERYRRGERGNLAAPPKPRRV